MRKIIKTALVIFIVLIIAIAVFSISVYLKYRSMEKQNIFPKLLTTEVVPKGVITLGDTGLLKYRIKCPWNKNPLGSEIFSGKGTQAIGEPEFIKVKTGWGYLIWDAIYKIQPYLTGNIPEGEIRVDFSPGIDKESDHLILKIPSFSSAGIPNVKDELSIADKINPKLERQSGTGKIYWLIAVAIVLILILLYWFIFRKSQEKTKPLTPWALALFNLHDLNDKFASGKLNAVKCISNLTDIVRNYLEARFYIHAPRQTTEEFLRNMENWDSPLNNKDRNFLREFMTSADMIKFAKYEASKPQVETAITRAEQLVDETIPETENAAPLKKLEEETEKVSK
jgi:hypothetical protein